MTLPAEIFVRFIGVGWHCWEDAPERRAYLSHSHRHLFHIEACCVVQHDDREIEFHDLMDEIKDLWNAIGGPTRDLGSQSCEMLARRIGLHLAETFARPWTVSVSEDGEAGARVSVGYPLVR